MKNLSNMKKNDAFKVPDNYFENLSDKVQNKIEQEESEKPKLIQLLKPYIWMAASIVVMVFIARIVLTNAVPEDYKIQKLSQTETTVSDTQSIITSLDDIDWFSDDSEDITSDELIEYLSDFDIETETLLANL